MVTVPPDTPDGGSTTATYDFFFPAPEQSGNYTCTATNERGSVSRSVTVEIIGASLAAGCANRMFEIS